MNTANGHRSTDRSILHLFPITLCMRAYLSLVWMCVGYNTYGDFFCNVKGDFTIELSILHKIYKYMHTHTCIHTPTLTWRWDYLYIYKERERGRERPNWLYFCSCVAANDHDNDDDALEMLLLLLLLLPLHFCILFRSTFVYIYFNATIARYRFESRISIEQHIKCIWHSVQFCCCPPVSCYRLSLHIVYYSHLHNTQPESNVCMCVCIKWIHWTE